jgi:hypothetical protein
LTSLETVALSTTIGFGGDAVQMGTARALYLSLVLQINSEEHFIRIVTIRNFIFRFLDTKNYLINIRA